MILQKPLIRYILEPVSRFMARFSPKLKDTLFVLACLGIILQFFGQGSGIATYRYLIFFAVDCVFLGIMLLCSMKPDMQPVKFRVLPMLCWYGVGFMLLQSGLLLNMDYLPEAVMFLIAYPVVFLVWSNSDASRIFRLLFTSMEISFVIYLAVSFLCFPMDEVRYSGLFNNLNGTAGYLAIAATCLLADCLLTEKFSVRWLLRLLLLGMCVSLLFYTSSRTGLLEIVMVAVVSVIVLLIRLWKQKKLFFFRNVLSVCLAVALLFPTTISLFQLGRPVAEQGERIIAQIIGSEDKAPGTKPKPPETDVITAEDSMNTTSARLVMDNRSFEQITTGRSTIWIEYLKQLNLLGHSDGGHVTFCFIDQEMSINTAHMTILQFGYENGIPAGLFYLAFNLIAGVYSVIHALRNKKDPWSMIPLMITIAYGVHSLLASTAVSFWYMSTFLYYLVQFPLLVKKQPAKLSAEA